MTASYLQIYLEPLDRFLNEPDVTDLYVNRPGEVWIERLGSQPVAYDVPGLTEALLWRLAQQVASLTHQGISREHPLLSARMPDGSRLQVVAPPATRGSMILAIRRHLSADMSLADYEASGAFNVSLGGQSETDDELSRLYRERQWGDFIRLAVRARKTILVSGGTSSGKTTFLNALLREIDQHERLCLIEDTPELALRHPNAVGMVAVRGSLGEANVTTEDLVTASLRLRPDRIILGEMRGGEALSFLRAVNTGHPGSMSTIHADSPEGAIEQLALLVLQAGAGLRRDDIIPYAKRVIDVVVQLERRNGKRQIIDIDLIE